MMFAVLPLLFLAFIIGFTALEADQVQANAGSTTANAAMDDAARFMIYRNAVLADLEANTSLPAASGSIALASLTMPNGVVQTNLPAGIGNYVQLGANGARTVYVYQTAQPGIIAAFNKEFPGDGTLGIVINSEWVTATAGATLAAPAFVPAGDILSVVQLGG